MSGIKDFLLNLGLPLAEEAEKEGVDTLLEKLFASNPDAYKATVFGLSAGFKAFKPTLDASSSKVVKGLVGALADEIRESAEKHGVVLDTPPVVDALATPPPDTSAAGTDAASETAAGPTVGSNEPTA